MSNLKSRLPSKKQYVVDDFILGAEDKAAKLTIDKRAASYPWNVQGVRNDMIKVYNLRLSEPYLLKLKFISENTPDSMQKFCLNVLQDAIDKKIKELTV